MDDLGVPLFSETPIFFWGGQKWQQLFSMDDSEYDFCHLREIELAKQPALSTLKQALKRQIWDRKRCLRNKDPATTLWEQLKRCVYHIYILLYHIILYYIILYYIILYYIIYIQILRVGGEQYNSAFVHTFRFVGEALPSLPSEHDVISLAEVVNPEARENCEKLDSLVGCFLK